MSEPIPPYLSVVIPTFHRNDSLAASLDALAPGKQTLGAEHYEVIVGDAGMHSTAEPMMHERFPWTQRVAAPGASPGVNRNTAARQARGEWLIFIDDDCRIPPDLLAAYQTHAHSGEWDVLEGRITCHEKVNSPFRRWVENETGGLFFTPNIAYRRSEFVRLGGFDEDLDVSEDMEMGRRAKAAGLRIRFCADAAVDHPSQSVNWHALVRWPFRRRWFILFRYKIGEGTPLDTSTIVALARVTIGELIYMLRITWHLFSQHSPSAWKFEWFKVAWTWLWSPAVVPCLWFWELRYRRLIRDGKIKLRSTPTSLATP